MLNTKTLRSSRRSRGTRRGREKDENYVFFSPLSLTRHFVSPQHLSQGLLFLLSPIFLSEKIKDGDHSITNLYRQAAFARPQKYVCIAGYLIANWIVFSKGLISPWWLSLTLGIKYRWSRYSSSSGNFPEFSWDNHSVLDKQKGQSTCRRRCTWRLLGCSQ